MLLFNNAGFSGGTAACVVAGRLAEADPGLSILVIEQGPNNLDVPTVVHPALAYEQCNSLL
jgi:choline dehydrogenase-like flavoprotein